MSVGLPSVSQRLVALGFGRRLALPGLSRDLEGAVGTRLRLKPRIRNDLLLHTKAEHPWSPDGLVLHTKLSIPDRQMIRCRIQKLRTNSGEGHHPGRSWCCIQKTYIAGHANDLVLHTKAGHANDLVLHTIARGLTSAALSSAAALPFSSSSTRTRCLQAGTSSHNPRQMMMIYTSVTAQRMRPCYYRRSIRSLGNTQTEEETQPAVVLASHHPSTHMHCCECVSRRCFFCCSFRTFCNQRGTYTHGGQSVLCQSGIFSACRRPRTRPPRSYSDGHRWCSAVIGPGR
jgi:hypothetical protein